jgi:putative acetyltransferase
LNDTIIRLEALGDQAEVATILRAAFGGEAEAKLVEELRANNDIVLSLSLVAIDENGAVIGYVAFSRLSVGGIACVGLAPVAVMPDRQGRGIGGALITRGMLALKQRGEKLAFVVGAPAYYKRFGFDPQLASAFTSEYSGPYFMAYRFAADAPSAGAVLYPPAFARLG